MVANGESVNWRANNFNYENASQFYREIPALTQHILNNGPDDQLVARFLRENVVFFPTMNSTAQAEMWKLYDVVIKYCKVVDENLLQLFIMALPPKKID